MRVQSTIDNWASDLKLHLFAVFVFDAVVEAKVLLNSEVIIKYVILKAKTDVSPDLINIIRIP